MRNVQTSVVGKNDGLMVGGGEYVLGVGPTHSHSNTPAQWPFTHTHLLILILKWHRDLRAQSLIKVGN